MPTKQQAADHHTLSDLAIACRLVVRDAVEITVTKTGKLKVGRYRVERRGVYSWCVLRKDMTCCVAVVDFAHTAVARAVSHAMEDLITEKLTEYATSQAGAKP